MPAPTATPSHTARWVAAGGLLALVAGVPLIVSSPGNDLDVAAIFRSGRSIVSQHTYLASRPPGAIVHEVIVGLADLVGGTVLVNLTSLVAAVAFAIGLDRLLAGEGLGPDRRWAIAVVVANPWFVVAATSAIDYLFGLAFVVWAAVQLRRGRWAWAGVLAGLAMGCRVGSAMLIAPMLLAEVTEPSRRRLDPGHDDTQDDTQDDIQDDTDLADDPEPGEAEGQGRWRAVAAGVVTAAVTVLLMVPAYRAAGGFEFAQNDFRTATPLVHLGRAAVKNVALIGPISCLAALLAAPALVRALRGWRTSWLVRFVVPGFLLSQLLFLRFPWKVSHLLPALLCGAVALAVALRGRPRLLVALAVLQLLGALVQIKLFAPDRPNQAEGADVVLEVTWGPVITDWRCRREHPDAYRGRQQVEVEAAWACSQPFSIDGRPQATEPSAGADTRHDRRVRR